MDNAGALVIGAAYEHLDPPAGHSGFLSLEEAAQVMNADGWPWSEGSTWPITNDEEEYIRVFANFPGFIVVNMSSMEVITVAEGAFGANGYDDVDDLIATISSF